LEKKLQRLNKKQRRHSKISKSMRKLKIGTSLKFSNYTKPFELTFEIVLGIDNVTA